ncbi:MAG: hypothetical protein GY913_27260 [Proteobacteria bacterium]|nr:hypothetical protein [Pseudomonadota bacterium]MCP4920614.1 hypothetical protein [Pseudomonadota bacterium]
MNGRVGQPDLPGGDYARWRIGETGAEAQRFTLEPGEGKAVEEPFGDAPVVSGRLVDADGQPWIGARITVQARQLGEVVATTDVDGAFSVGLPPGDHAFRLGQKTADGWRHFDELAVTVAQDDVALGDVVR